MFNFTVKDMAWREPDKPSSQFRLDYDFGVRRIENSFVMNTSVCSDTVRMWNGIPVKFSELITNPIARLKKWRRRGRPDKVKMWTIHVPAILVLNEAKFKSIGSDKTDPVIYMHPKLKPLLLKESNYET